MPASAALAELKILVNRRFGNLVAGPADTVLETECCSPATAIPFGLRRLLGPAGIPKGRLTEIFGLRSSGKTALAFAALAECTQAGELGAYVDCSGALYAPAAAAAGIELRRLVVVRPRAAADARRAIDALVRGGAFTTAIFDCADAGRLLETHHCARLVAQAEKTGTTLVVLSSGDLPAVASFAALRLRACGLTPLWQSGSDGGMRLMGCEAAVEVAKARTLVAGHAHELALLLPDIDYAMGPSQAVPGPAYAGPTTQARFA